MDQKSMFEVDEEVGPLKAWEGSKTLGLCRSARGKVPYCSDLKRYKVPAITVCQPWAELICRDKWIENRCWPVRYTGPLLIHAGSGKSHLKIAGELGMPMDIARYTTGALVAIADLVGCVDGFAAIDLVSHKRGTDQFSASQLREIMLADYVEGQFLFVLQNVRRIKPVEVPGKQKLWEVPPEVVDTVVGNHPELSECLGRS